MNAIEMAAKAMLDKFIGNLPPEVLQNIGQIGQIALSLKVQLDRIESQQRLILTILETQHAQRPDDQSIDGADVRNGPDQIGSDHDRAG